MHIFVDASEKAYRAVRYIKTNNNGNVSCKSRLTPLTNKLSLTIPRLQLEAALIAGRLVKTILQISKIPVSNVSLWCDSKTVLKTIKNRETQFQKSILRRTHKINSITKAENWNYIESNLNVADDLAKCINLAQFDNNNQMIQNAPHITESDQNKILDWIRYLQWESQLELQQGQ